MAVDHVSETQEYSQESGFLLNRKKMKSESQQLHLYIFFWSMTLLSPSICGTVCLMKISITQLVDYANPAF